MLWLRNKKNNFQIGTLTWRPGLGKPQNTDKSMHMGSLAEPLLLLYKIYERELKLDMYLALAPLDSCACMFKEKNLHICQSTKLS